MEYKHLIDDFLKAMDEIGEYGENKYTSDSFQIRRIANDRKRFTERVEQHELRRHAGQHFIDYTRGMVHDHFGTLRHQLAAVAFNAMMEYYFARLDYERIGRKHV